MNGKLRRKAMNRRLFYKRKIFNIINNYTTIVNKSLFYKLKINLDDH